MFKSIGRVIRWVIGKIIMVSVAIALLLLADIGIRAWEESNRDPYDLPAQLPICQKCQKILAANHVRMDRGSCYLGIHAGNVTMNALSLSVAKETNAREDQGKTN